MVSVKVHDEIKEAIYRFFINAERDFIGGNKEAKQEALGVNKFALGLKIISPEDNKFNIECIEKWQ